MLSQKPVNGMRTFTIIWFGQFVSSLGTGMTRFAFLIWAYQQTAAEGNPATTLALLGFFAWLLTLVEADAARRAFAAYGGIYYPALIVLP